MRFALPESIRRWSRCALSVALAATAGCAKEEPPATYASVLVEKRTIVVSASATGVLEPVRAVDVKSKASGEIMELDVETGDDVHAGQLLAVIDPRLPKNTLAPTPF
jgi:HlyD family secretion protein